MTIVVALPFGPCLRRKSRQRRNSLQNEKKRKNKTKKRHPENKGGIPNPSIGRSEKRTHAWRSADLSRQRWPPKAGKGREGKRREGKGREGGEKIKQAGQLHTARQTASFRCDGAPLFLVVSSDISFDLSDLSPFLPSLSFRPRPFPFPFVVYFIVISLLSNTLGAQPYALPSPLSSLGRRHYSAVPSQE